MADPLMPLRFRNANPEKKVASTLLIVGASVAALTCSDRGTVAPDNVDAGAPPAGIVISNPHAALVSTANLRTVFSAADDEIVYVSLVPKTLPNAIRAQIDNRTRNRPGSTIRVIDGGFDPVAVEAAEGDTLELVSSTFDGHQETLLVRVPAKRPPSVVRSKPPKGLTDVALNVVIGVVFTEPVDETTLNGSTLQLLRNGKPVAGRIILPANSWNAEFVPETNLEPNATYELIVTTGVRDLDGDALDQSYAASFVTGTGMCDGVAAAEGCLIFPIEGNSVVSGAVIERTVTGQRPVANATISVWVQLSNGTGYALSPISSDANGKYSIGSLPTTAVQLHASVPGLDQWCGVVAWPSQPGVVANIELRASGSAPQRGAWGMTLSGFVYESVQAARQPVPGATISFESRMNVVAATATSDADGNFIMCNLPSLGQQMISISKAGYQINYGPIALAGGEYGMTVPLTRSPP